MLARHVSSATWPSTQRQTICKCSKSNQPETFYTRYTEEGHNRLQRSECQLLLLPPVDSVSEWCLFAGLLLLSLGNVTNKPLDPCKTLVCKLHIEVSFHYVSHFDFFLRDLEKGVAVLKQKSRDRILNMQLCWLSWFPWTSTACVMTAALWEMYSCCSFPDKLSHEICLTLRGIVVALVQVSS